jgi:hypothetical protein
VMLIKLQRKSFLQRPAAPSMSVDAFSDMPYQVPLKSLCDTSAQWIAARLRYEAKRPHANAAPTSQRLPSQFAFNALRQFPAFVTPNKPILERPHARSLGRYLVAIARLQQHRRYAERIAKWSRAVNLYDTGR